MPTATVYQLRPKSKAAAELSPAELQTIDDHPEAAAQGIVASILAHGLNIMTSPGEREPRYGTEACADYRPAFPCPGSGFVRARQERSGTFCSMGERSSSQLPLQSMPNDDNAV